MNADPTDRTDLEIRSQAELNFPKVGLTVLPIKHQRTILPTDSFRHEKHAVNMLRRVFLRADDSAAKDRE
jgi:hypothetical protein